MKKGPGRHYEWKKKSKRSLAVEEKGNGDAAPKGEKRLFKCLCRGEKDFPERAVLRGSLLRKHGEDELYLLGKKDISPQKGVVASY